MATKAPKYTGRKFVRPYSKKYGRRTGKEVLAGKTIRVDQDGMQNFDDYLSESDLDITRERNLMQNIQEERESQESDDSAKENVASRSNIIVSQSVPNQSKYNDSAVSQSQLSQASKLSNRSRFGWLRNKNIGRRTGKDVKAGKLIRRDEDGIEIFEDYLSPSSGTESFVSFSSAHSHSKEPKPGLANENDGKDFASGGQSPEGKITKLSPLDQHTDNLSKVRSKVSSELDVVNVAENEEENEEDSGDELETRKDCDDENENKTEKTVSSLKEQNNNRSQSETHRRTVAGQGSTVYTNDFESEFKSYIEETHKSRNSIASVNENETYTSSQTHRYSGAENQSSVSGQEAEGDSNPSGKIMPDKSKSNFNTIDYKELDRRRKRLSQVTNKSLSKNDTTLSVRSVNKKNEPESSVTSNKKVSETRLNMKQEKSGKKGGSATQTIHADEVDDEQSGDDTDDQSHESDDFNKDDNRQNEIPDIQESSSAQTSQIKNDATNDLDQQDSNDGDDEIDDEMPLSSQTGIDVAGNRSGSITKLEAPDTSKVSFDKTRKRLSYSALEMSEEMKKARLSRIREANKSLQEKSSKSEQTSFIGRLSKSTMEENILLSKVDAEREEKTKEKTDSDITDQVDILSDVHNKKTQNQSHKASEKTHTDSEYYDPGDFVHLASVAKRRSTYVASKFYESDNDSIEILDDDVAPKKPKKSVRGKKSIPDSRIEKMPEGSIKDKSKTSKKVVKSKRTKSNAQAAIVNRSNSEDHENKISANVDKSTSKGKGFIMTEHLSDSVDEIMNDPNDSEIETVDLPNNKWNRNSMNGNKTDSRKSLKAQHEIDTDGAVAEKNEEMGKSIDKIDKGKETAKQQGFKEKGKNKASNVGNTKTKKTVSDEAKHSETTEQNKKSRKQSASKSASSMSGQNVALNEIDQQKNETAELANDPYELNEEDSENKELFIEGEDVVDNVVEIDTLSKMTDDKMGKGAEKVTKSGKILPNKTSCGPNAKTLNLKRKCNTKSITGTKRLPSKSSVRNSRLKSGSSVSNRNKALPYGSKREKTNVQNEEDNGANESVPEPKKTKTIDSETEEQLSAKRKLEFNKKVAEPVKRKHKSLGEKSLAHGGLKNSVPRRKSYHDKVCATPAVNSTLSLPTNFNSGVSIRVSRRAEILDKISSGFGNIPNISSRQPPETLTPCITKGNKSRKSKGNRVSICPVESTVLNDEEHNTLSESTIRKKKISRMSSLGTTLPSVSSSPKHYCEQSKPGTPAVEKRKSLGYTTSRIIKPEPAPPGLRRSKRNRLPPVDWNRGERIIYRCKNLYDYEIIGVKESNEIKYNKWDAEKRKRRQLMNQIRKAMKTDKSKGHDRKLSIHIKLPEDAEPVDTAEISVPDPSGNESFILDCMAKSDSVSFVGPSHSTPTKDDPYLIKKLLDQPIFSTGHLLIRPGCEKPPQVVENCCTVFTIHFGKLLVTVHNTTGLFETGDSFFVPLGCSYSIKNLRNDNAQLFYTLLKGFPAETPNHVAEK